MAVLELMTANPQGWQQDENLKNENDLNFREKQITKEDQITKEAKFKGKVISITEFCWKKLWEDNLFIQTQLSLKFYDI